MAERNPDCRQRNERIDEEDPAPTRVIDDEAADERPNCRRDCGDPGPGSDCLAPFVLAEGGADDRQGAWNQQCGSRALNQARRDQLCGAGGEPAPDRRDGENRGADDEHLAAAEMVAGGAADQDECGQRQRVGIHQPLDHHRRSSEIVLDCRQGDVDHGLVDEGHARRQDGGHEHPTFLAVATRRGAPRRADRCFVARPRAKADHVLAAYARAAIASAIATVRRAMSACRRSTMRPSSCTTPLPLFSGRSKAAMIFLACATSSSPGEKVTLQGPIWFGWMSVLPSKPISRACAHSCAKPSALPRSL